MRGAILHGMQSSDSRAVLHLFLGFLSLVLGACGQRITVSVSSGPIDFQVAAGEFGLPADLDDGGRVAEVPCAMGGCPLAAAGGAPIELGCDEADRCDPGPLVVTVPVGDVVDFDRFASEAQVPELLASIERIDVEEAHWRVSTNTANVGLPEVEIYWGPASATEVDPAQGVRSFGFIGPIAAGMAQEGDVRFDRDGAEALSEHLLRVERTARFFLRTTVDIDPGDPFPAGRVEGDVNLRVVFGGPGL